VVDPYRLVTVAVLAAVAVLVAVKITVVFASKRVPFVVRFRVFREIILCCGLNPGFGVPAHCGDPPVFDRAVLAQWLPIAKRRGPVFSLGGGKSH